ncbi:MAG: AMP-binding protein [Luminiphilus sp.]|nr:MAG: long-chain fatty acid--CoA ligase [Halieaceae bacterium MED-G26]
MQADISAAIAARYDELNIEWNVDVTAYTSIVALFEEAMTDYAEMPACSSVGHALSYAELDTLSANFASWLQNESGLSKGDRVAIQMPNLIQYLVACLGTLRAGMVVVNTNPLYTERELEHQLNDSGARILVVQANVAETAANVVAKTGIEKIVLTEIADLHPAPKRWLLNAAVKYIKKMVPKVTLPNVVKFNDALRRGAQGQFTPVELSLDDLAMLQYTGGTTGVAKGAMLSHGNIVANVMQIDGFFETFGIDARGSVFMQPLPVYHIYAFTVSMYSLRKGAHTLFIPNPRDLGSVVDAFEKYQPTVFAGLNTLFVALCNDERFKSIRFENLQLTMSGGMALTQAAAERWAEVTGCHVYEGYGLTETSPTATTNPGNGRQLGTIGIPVPQTYVKTVTDTGETLGFGEAGELCIKGPQVMQGYWQRPEATADVLDDEGWFSTGDVAVIQPDGYIKIVDRIKDMIIVSGFNVYPNELEDVCAKHPGVLECAAVGVPSEATGEAIRLYVVKANDALSEDDVMAYMREQVTGYKVPKSIVFKDDLPKTNVGKILRRELRDLAANG